MLANILIGRVSTCSQAIRAMVSGSTSTRPVLAILSTYPPLNLRLHYHPQPHPISTYDHSTNPTGMPRIPKCAQAIAALALSRHQSPTNHTTPDALAAFRRAIPQPYWLTRERMESKVNLILGMMGQGSKVAGAMQGEEEVGVTKEGVEELAHRVEAL
jgi:hypothetical protein